MRVLFLAANWHGYDASYNSLVSVLKKRADGAENQVDLLRFDLAHPRLDGIKMQGYKLIVAVPVNGGYCTLPNALWKAFRKIAPTVCLCPEASDAHWWWKNLQSWIADECFDLLVNIDGSEDWPHRPQDLTLLTPLDEDIYADPLTWAARDIRLGVSSNLGSERMRLYEALGDRLTIRHMTPGDTYRDYVQFMKRCKFVLNTSGQGAGGGQHVKGRVVETGWACACLLEPKGSPAAQWFIPGKDYIEYESAEHLIKMLGDASFNDYGMSCAANLHDKVHEEHTAFRFWTKVFRGVGL